MIRQSDRARRPRPDGYEDATAYGFVLASGAWLAGTALLHLAGEQAVAAGATPTGAFTLTAVLWVWLGATVLITALGLGLICGPDRHTAALCLLGVAAAMLHPAIETVTWSPASLEARVTGIARLPRAQHGSGRCGTRGRSSGAETAGCSSPSNTAGTPPGV